MLLKLAWRNIWRNRLRSLVIMLAIIVGVAASIFLLSFMIGMVRSYINNTIQNEISHIQIHDKSFKEDYEVKYFFTDVEKKINKIQSQENVEAVTSRTIANGIISSSKASRGVFIRGVDSIREVGGTKLDDKIIEGEFLSEKKKNPIVISKRLAEKLKLKLRKKLILRFQDVDGEIVDGAFRITGIYKTDKNLFDDGNVFVRQKDLNQLLGIFEGAHEIAIFLKNETQLQKDSTQIQAATPNLLVETFEQISPDVRLFREQIKISSTFIMFIIMLALIFGIINTMLMAVLERYRELGMLMAVGMNKAKVFAMIVLETLLLGLISAPIGMLIGYLLVLLTRRNGIDLSAYSDGMAEFGMSSMVYPSLETGVYWQLAVAVLLTTVLGALYPAYKAIRLKPVEAIRKI